jgi:hypothetical protein
MSEHACQSMFWFASGLVVTEAQREKVGEGRGDLRVRGFLAVLGMTGLVADASFLAQRGMAGDRAFCVGSAPE